MLINKKQFLIVTAIIMSFSGITALALITGGDFSLLGKVVGISSRISGGDYVIEQSAGEAIGVTKMTGGDYELSSTAVTGAAAKLENDLALAHCYPNPYKPHSGLGHSKITFSRLTKRTKIRIFTISGELVYEADQDTPSGEMVWDVRNKYGDDIASGVYIYLLADDTGHRAKGKFAVIR